MAGIHSFLSTTVMTNAAETASGPHSVCASCYDLWDEDALFPGGSWLDGEKAVDHSGNEEVLCRLNGVFTFPHAS